MPEVGFARMARAGRERAGVIPDLEQVAELVIGLVSIRLVTVVALERGDRFQFHGE
jgi:hypothetical protein